MTMLRRTAVVTAMALAAAGCSSGSGHDASPSPSASVAPTQSASALTSPVIDPENQAVDEMSGTATITWTTSSGAAHTVHTSEDEPAQVSVDAHGQVRVEVTMQNGAGDLFSVAGPAAVGAVRGDDVSVLVPANGIFIDTSQGNVCRVSFTRADETGVAGTTSCDGQSGLQSYTVNVSFRLH